MTSKSPAFQEWFERYDQSGDLGCVRLGATRDQVRAWFGEPDDTAPGFRRRPQTGIWRYGIVEFHFSTTGHLYLVFSEQPAFGPRVILSDVRNETKNDRNV